jgi:hypothetical protein
VWPALLEKLLLRLPFFAPALTSLLSRIVVESWAVVLNPDS